MQKRRLTSLAQLAHVYFKKPHKLHIPARQVKGTHKEQNKWRHLRSLLIERENKIKNFKPRKPKEKQLSKSEKYIAEIKAQNARLRKLPIPKTMHEHTMRAMSKERLPKYKPAAWETKMTINRFFRQEMTKSFCKELDSARFAGILHYNDRKVFQEIKPLLNDIGIHTRIAVNAPLQQAFLKSKHFSELAPLCAGPSLYLVNHPETLPKSNTKEKDAYGVKYLSKIMKVLKDREDIMFMGCGLDRSVLTIESVGSVIKDKPMEVLFSEALDQLALFGIPKTIDGAMAQIIGALEARVKQLEEDE